MSTQDPVDMQAVLQKMSDKRQVLDTQIDLLEKDMRVFHRTLKTRLDKESIRRVLEKIVDNTSHI